MLLSVDWDGSAIPFEGDRPIPIRTIPEGAKVASARVTVTPIDPGAAVADLNGFNDSFVEHIVFSGAGPTWGANKVQGANFVEVDFRARRTLAAAQVVTAGGNLKSIPAAPTWRSMIAARYSALKPERLAFSSPPAFRYSLPSRSPDSRSHDWQPRFPTSRRC